MKIPSHKIGKLTKKIIDIFLQPFLNGPPWFFVEASTPVLQMKHRKVAYMCEYTHCQFVKNVYTDIFFQHTHCLLSLAVLFGLYR